MSKIKVGTTEKTTGNNIVFSLDNGGKQISLTSSNDGVMINSNNQPAINLNNDGNMIVKKNLIIDNNVTIKGSAKIEGNLEFKGGSSNNTAINNTTINNTTIGETTPSTGGFTNLSATNIIASTKIKAPLLEVDEIKYVYQTQTFNDSDMDISGNLQVHGYLNMHNNDISNVKDLSALRIGYDVSGKGAFTDLSSTNFVSNTMSLYTQPTEANHVVNRAYLDSSWNAHDVSMSDIYTITSDLSGRFDSSWNAHNSSINTLFTYASDLSGKFDNSIGDVSDLSTTATTVVGAINEIYSRGISISATLIGDGSSPNIGGTYSDNNVILLIIGDDYNIGATITLSGTTSLSADSPLISYYAVVTDATNGTVVIYAKFT